MRSYGLDMNPTASDVSAADLHEYDLVYNKAFPDMEVSSRLGHVVKRINLQCDGDCIRIVIGSTRHGRTWLSLLSDH